MLSGRELFATRAHAADVKALAWSPDGCRLASASTDDTVKVWDGASGEELLTLHSPPKGNKEVAGLHSVAWRPDGKRLAVADVYDVIVWEAPGFPVAIGVDRPGGCQISPGAEARIPGRSLGE